MVMLTDLPFQKKSSHTILIDSIDISTVWNQTETRNRLKLEVQFL